jgi:hypothetical protein
MLLGDTCEYELWMECVCLCVCFFGIGSFNWGAHFATVTTDNCLCDLCFAFFVSR